MGDGRAQDAYLFSESPAARKTSTLEPSTAPLPAGEEAFDPICSSSEEKAESGDRNVVRGSARITGKGELARRYSPTAAGRRERETPRPPSSQLGSRRGGSELGICGGWRGAGVVDGQWQMEGWVWRVGRPPCGSGPQVRPGVGPQCHGPRVRDVGATLIFFKELSAVRSLSSKNSESVRLPFYKVIYFFHNNFLQQ